TVQGRQTQRYASSGVRSSAIGSSVNRNRGTSTAVNGDTVTIGQASPEIPTPTAFQTDNLDAFESDCDEAPSASAVLMAKLSNYDSNILLEVPTHDTYLDNQVIDQSVQEMQYSEQPVFNNDSDIDITSDSNMIFL
ncbi:hypothetical protein Tco_1428763, partial [Tanacetum coccineum]